MRYSFDTSALINPWNHHYPPDSFPTYWGRVQDMVSAGEIVASDMVYYELEKKDDDLLAWARARRSMFIEVDQEQLMIVESIVNRFPEIVDPDATREQADPFVVALAKQKGLTVVTDETMPPKGRVKIPQVCRALDVECLSVLAFIRKEKIVS